MKRKLFIIFLTGLTNSGKTTISNLLFKYFKNIGLKSKNIDGDKFRKKIKNLNSLVSQQFLEVVPMELSYIITQQKKLIGYLKKVISI